jgi:hypothetical protein
VILQRYEIKRRWLQGSFRHNSFNSNTKGFNAMIKKLDFDTIRVALMVITAFLIGLMN